MTKPDLAQREKIIEFANGANFDIKLKNNKLIPGRIAGINLDYPLVYNFDYDISFEVSWALAEKLSNSTQKIIAE